MIQTLLAQYQPISLKALDERARLMRRTDNKYVLDQEQLQQFLIEQLPYYDILCIDGLRQFHYVSAYLDSPQFDTFLDHNQGRRQRFKIRFRYYRETQQYFFEIKLKGFRGETLKYRVATNEQAYQAQVLPDDLYQFANTKIQQHYGRTLTFPLKHSIRVTYQRITLVDKQGGERITIDNQIQFFGTQAKQSLPADHYVIEVKSALGRSPVDRWLRQQQKHPVQRCSKYCMGLNLLKFPQKNTRFRPVLKRYFHYQPDAFR